MWPSTRCGAVWCPAGGLYLFNQAPGWKSRKPAEEFCTTLALPGFEIERRLVNRIGGGFAAAVSAVKSS